MHEPGSASVLRFDGVEIDLIGRRLLRDGQPQAIEPKAFAVLRLLAEQPGRAFSRDEILDAVWGHRHITPGTLNRVVTLLRHALGESAEQPRYLHTVHGVGYRLDARIQRTEPQAPATLPAAKPDVGSEGSDPPSEPASTVDPGPADEHAAAPVSATALPFGRRLEDNLRSDDAARGDRRQRAPSRLRRWGLLAAIVTGLAVVALLRWPTAPAPDPAAAGAPRPAVPTPTPVLAVLPLRPLGDDTRNAEFADGLSEELVSLLSRIDGLRVTSHTSSVQLRGESAPLPELARRLGASHVLEGSVRQQGERLRIALRLVDAGNDATLWSESFDRPFADIFAVQDSVARAVGEALRLRLTLPPSGFGVNEDPQLYMRYLQARQRMPVRLSGHLNLQPARELLEALTREHPGYARAWGGLAAVNWMGSANLGPQGQTMREEAEIAASRALALDPEQPDAMAVLAGQACRQQNWPLCADYSQRAVDRAPSDSMWRFWLSHRLATMGYVAAALREIDIALAVDPLNAPLNYWRGRILDTLGRHEDAFRHLQLADTQAVGPSAHYYNAIWRNDLTTARSIAEGLHPDTPWRGSMLLLVAALQDPTGLPALREAIAATESRLAGQGVHVPYDFTRWFLPDRDYDLDIRALDRVQRTGYATYQWIFWMPRERALRQTPAFQRYLRDSGLLAFWRENGWPDVCRSDGGEGVVCD